MYTPFSQKFIWRNFKMHACSTCERAFNATKLLNSTKNDVKYLLVRKTHICPNCDKGFNNKRHLIPHVKKCNFVRLGILDSFSPGRRSYSGLRYCIIQLQSFSFRATDFKFLNLLSFRITSNISFTAK